MEIKEVLFIKSVVDVENLPRDNLTEISFLGRSNVGKSSCIKTLLNRNKMVKISARPGVTTYLNYFLINKKFYFVDFPGYGYSTISKKIKNTYEKLIQEYFKRNNLKLCFLILDPRRELDKLDLVLIEFLNHNKINWKIIVTKIDKLSKSKLIEYFNKLSKKINVDKQNMFIFSSLKKIGREEVLKEIFKNI